MTKLLLRALWCSGLVALTVGPLAAQDTIARRIALGITYSGGARPGMIVIGSPGLDSVRRIIERDLLVNSDHYEPAVVPDSTSAAVFTMSHTRK